MWKCEAESCRVDVLVQKLLKSECLCGGDRLTQRRARCDLIQCANDASALSDLMDQVDGDGSPRLEQGFVPASTANHRTLRMHA